MMAAAEMRHAGADHRIRQLAASGDAQAAVVEEGAAAAFGRVELVHGRIVDHGRRPAGPGAPARSRSRRCGMPCRKLVVPSSGSTIQRCWSSLPSISPRSSIEEAIGRAGLRQLVVDDLFRLAVGLADIVARTLQRDLQVLHFAEIARQRAAGLHCGLDHDIEDRRTCHASLLFRHGAGQSARRR